MPRKDYRKCPYKYKTLEALKILAKDRGILLPPRCTKDDLISLLKQQDHRNQWYLKYTVKDLKAFIQDRKINFQTTNIRKETLMRVLTEADAEWTFPLLSLPPELRYMIYEFSMAIDPAKSHSFHERSQFAFMQVSRIVRQESMPVLYKRNCS